MITFQSELKELLQQTQLYLMKRLQSQNSFFCDPKSYSFFKKLSLSPPRAAAHFSSPPLQTQKNDEPSVKVAIKAEHPPLPQETNNPILSSASSSETKNIQEKKGVSPSLINKKEFQSFFTVHFPAIPLVDEIPDDLVAKQKKEEWKELQESAEILIFSIETTESCFPFLKALERAISRLLAPVKIVNAQEIEKMRGWDRLLASKKIKIILAEDAEMRSLPGLMEHYRENAKEESFFLQAISLIPMAPLSSYQQKPELKALLWRALTNAFNLPK